jgi:anthranilate phosphoribosyltransferase
VLPSYNGARKLPVLTPLLALLLAREGLPVLIHGTATESSRVLVRRRAGRLDLPPLTAIRPSRRRGGLRAHRAAAPA